MHMCTPPQRFLYYLNIVPDKQKRWWFLDIFNSQMHSEHDHQIQ